MKIEEGKFYRTRDGQKVGPLRWGGSCTFPWEESLTFPWVDGNHCWTRSGYYWSAKEKSSFDLVAEWTDTPKTWGEMTDAEKGALLLGIYQGKEHQFSKDGEKWNELTPFSEFQNDYYYRVRPEPKRETVALYCGHEWQASKDCHHGTHRITFDLIDGEPDCDSVRMKRL